MIRVQLEQLNVYGLQEVARQQTLDIRGTRAVLLDRLIDHFERNGWPDQLQIAGPSTAEGEIFAPVEASQPTAEEVADLVVPLIADKPVPERQAAVSFPNMQDIVQAVVRAMESGQARLERSNPPSPRRDPGISPAMSSGPQSSVLRNWNQIKFTSKLIPTFAGKEEENVVTWLERIGSIGRLHQITDDVLVLAAVNQLTGRALDWYNRQSVECVSTWEEFKFQIRAYFQRKETVTMTLARVSGRTWRTHSEKFMDYAEDKLKLMQFLKLTEKEKIELLADGVKDPSLRKFALNTWASTVPDFIDYIRKITEDSVVTRRPDQGSKPVLKTAAYHKDRTCTHCKKTGHWVADCRLVKLTCYNCGQRGHLSSACTKKRKTEPGSILNHLTQETREEAAGPEDSFPEETASNNIYLIENDTPYVTVYSLGNKFKSFCALVDTGSPVSLIKKSIYSKYFGNNKLLQNRENLNLKGINNSAIVTYGKICDQICLEKLTDQWFDVTLLVVDDNAIAFDMLLGREFFNKTKIKLTYQKGTFLFEYPSQTKKEVDHIFSIEAVSDRDKYDMVMENLDNLDFLSKTKLIEMLREIDSMDIEPIKDEYKIRVHLKDASFYRYAPRRMSIGEKNELCEITDNLLKRGIIKPSTSPYCARIVLVNKRNGTKRMCVDLRPLNQRIYPQKYPFPVIDDQIDQLYGKKIFTKLDLRDGFHQIEIHPDDTKYFAFATPYGQYEYVKMPFGYSEAPAEFQKRILHIFKSMLRSGKILLYMDDILIATTTVEENLTILKDVLITLRKYSLELNIAKCLFLKGEIEFLGYLISGEGITLNKRHIQAILDFPYPKNLKQLQGFLGLTNYFRKFIKDYALKAKPLHNLTRKNVKFDFHEECERSFDFLKTELTSPPVLHIFNPTAETEVHTDASSHGFGAVLLQKQEKGYMAPIAYFNKATNEAEKRYHSFELETLAIVKALDRFHVYLQGISFRVITDCNSLALAIKKININPRIARWTLSFQNYKFELMHRSSEKMEHVDFLSRNFMNVNLITAEDELMYRQLTDTKLKEIAEQVELHGSKKFSLIDGLLFRNYKNKDLFVVPETMVNNLIRLYHDEVGHVGVDKTMYGILDHYWFPNLKLKIKQYIENCITCLSCSIPAGKTEGEMQIYEKDTIPFQTIHIDHFGPLEVTSENFKHIFVTIDAFTKFVWLFPTRSTGTDETIECLTTLFSLLGTPKRIISDRGTAFTSHNFSEFMKKNNIKHVLTAVASPWANGQVERVNSFLKSTLSKVAEDPTKWKEKLNTVQYVLNNTYNKAIDSTPSKTLFGFDQRR